MTRPVQRPPDDATEVTVALLPIVEHFNVIEDISPNQIPGFIDAFSDAFFFLRAEELFGYRVDAPMSIADDWHRLGPIKSMGRVLGRFIILGISRSL